MAVAVQGWSWANGPEQPLECAVERGSLRADLFARLHGVGIRVPALRARREEVLSLFQQALAKHSERAQELDADLAEWLCLYDWPLNVRELIQLAGRMSVEQRRAERLSIEHLPANFRRNAGHDSGASSQPTRAGRGVDLQRPGSPDADRRPVDRAQFSCALRDNDGNVALTARTLGISRAHAYRLIDSMPELSLKTLRRSGGDPKS